MDESVGWEVVLDVGLEVVVGFAVGFLDVEVNLRFDKLVKIYLIHYYYQNFYCFLCNPL